ncbi:conjugative relaxase [Ferruginibacter sp. HRS2-29]|nr:conjugative relaxase [Ferruginibacter sp. HRS2-29]
MIQSASEGHAKAYFSDALSKSDYYINDQELSRGLHGRLRDRLGLGEEVTKEIFFSLCENRNPKTGEPLTPRTRQKRRAGYDINFHAPKSVSIVHALSKDTHISDAFQTSVNEVMKAIEKDCQTRVRKDGSYHNRATDEILWAEFMHQTARPVDGHAPDPHLHSHCYVYNATWDKEEKRIKAGDFAEIKKDMPYYQAMFHKVFSDRLIECGYSIKRTGKSFELEGVPEAVIGLFSKRTDEIGRYAKEHGITDSEKLSAVGARTRSKKQKGLSMSELKTIWRQQIKEFKGIPAADKDKAIRYAQKSFHLKLTTLNCVDYALKHSFERASVIGERRLLESAFRHGIGDRRITSDAIAQAVRSDLRIIKVKDKNRFVCTTKGVLAEEKEMVDLARKGQGQLRPLYSHSPNTKLEGQQANAVRHVLTTSHRVSIIRGVAGAGKTTLMKEAKRLFEEKGKTITTVAPSSSASRGTLKEEGFEQATTVAKLLLDKKMKDELKNGVLWVDEAGLLGTKDMTALLKLATNQNAQLILGGDTRQHASVVRGDALRILNTVGGITTAEVGKIHRQQDMLYKETVEDLSKGKIVSAFGKLETMGAIEEIDPLNPNDSIVKDYLAFLKKRKSALIISPTHQQGEQLTRYIRESMKANKLIGKKEITAKKLINQNLTEAQKTDWRNIKEGQVIQFNQNVHKIKRGSFWTIKQSDKGKTKIVNDSGEEKYLPHQMPDRFDVFERAEIKISKGDKIRITKGGFDDNKKRLDNGNILEVLAVSKKGEITLQNKISKARYKINKEFGYLAHAHVITSHAAQGKTVDHVLISQPASTFAATDAKQFYVSVSRGKHSAKIYTDDKESLLRYASNFGDRQSATELVVKDSIHLDHVINNQRKEYAEKVRTKERDKNYSSAKIERDYEPGI